MFFVFDTAMEELGIAYKKAALEFSKP